eukprot:m51a1_g8917 hypothetical protein (530) ;mRNA; f:801477-804907
MRSPSSLALACLVACALSQTPACTYTASDGSAYDLSALTLSGRTYDLASPLPGTWRVNVCGAAPVGPACAPSSPVCFNVGDTAFYYSYGSIATWQLRDHRPGVVATVTQGETCYAQPSRRAATAYTSSIVIDCDRSAKVPQFYKAEGSPATSLAVCVVLYVACGVLVNWRLRGLSGVEVLPNVGMWSALAGLVKDGFMFAVTGGRAPACLRSGISADLVPAMRVDVPALSLQVQLPDGEVVAALAQNLAGMSVLALCLGALLHRPVAARLGSSARAALALPLACAIAAWPYGPSAASASPWVRYTCACYAFTLLFKALEAAVLRTWPLPSARLCLGEWLALYALPLNLSVDAATQAPQRLASAAERARLSAALALWAAARYAGAVALLSWTAARGDGLPAGLVAAVPYAELRGRPGLGSAAAFLASGLLHEYAYSAAYAGEGAPCAGWALRAFAVEALLDAAHVRAAGAVPRGLREALPGPLCAAALQAALLWTDFNWGFVRSLHAHGFLRDYARMVGHVALASPSPPP